MQAGAHARGALCAALQEKNHDFRCARLLLGVCAREGGTDDFAFELVWAVTAGNHRAVELLLEEGANPDLPGTLMGHQAEFTPLNAAAHFGHAKCVRPLLAAKADATLRFEGESPLDHARFQARARTAPRTARPPPLATHPR